MAEAQALLFDRPRIDLSAAARDCLEIALLLRLGEHRLAVPAEQVVRVARIDRLWTLPSDLECNLGVVVHAQVAVGVVDLEMMLELPIGRRPHPWPASPFLCVFARFAGGVAGFPVDRVRECHLHRGRGSSCSGYRWFYPSQLEELR